MAQKKKKAEKEVPARGYRWKSWLSPALLLLLTLVMFGDVLLDSGTVLSRLGNDLSTQFIAWREFGFGQLRNGHLALWNPYLFAGIPYVGGFQSAMFYPPNLVHLVLPVAVAINVLIALHIFLGGLFMYFWAMRRGLHPLAATMSGSLLMFCGAQFLHVYAGHLPNLNSMAWGPLLFLAVDGLFETRRVRWCLLGMTAMAMMILAGHPQYVFYTIVAVGIYWCFRIVKVQGRLAVTTGLAAIFIGAMTLSAVQLLTGLDASAQSVRSQGAPYEFAAMFSFPPENLLTLVVPNFFGDMTHSPYWGRCYLWEMSLFMSLTGLVLAIYGSISGDKHLRVFSLPMVVILLLLAMGSHTPLFKVLYDYFPGFAKFRGTSKFIFQLSLFLTMLAGVGLDTLLRAERKNLRLTLYLAGSALAAVTAGFALISGTADNPAQWWHQVMKAVSATKESYLPPQLYSAAEFVSQAAARAASGMFVAAGTLALLAGLAFASRRWRWSAYGIAVLALIEVFVFARSSRATFDLTAARMPQLQQFLKERPGDYRVLNLANPNLAMLTGKGDLWGYDPGVSLRYAQFMAFTQQESPDRATQYLAFKQPSRLYGMLRLKYVFVPEGRGQRIFEEKNALGRLQLIYDYEVLSGRDRILNTLSGDFNPARKVILESQPQPAPKKPGPDPAGEVRMIDFSTDHMTIQADLSSPTILLITDGYSKDWQAKALSGSDQSQYQVMPANYVLMAVPLSAGHHHFRLEYAPRAFEMGKWISLAALAAFLVAAGQLMLRRKTPNSQKSIASKN